MGREIKCFGRCWIRRQFLKAIGYEARLSYDRAGPPDLRPSIPPPHPASLDSRPLRALNTTALKTKSRAFRLALSFY
jgi:hypothetical protein